MNMTAEESYRSERASWWDSQAVEEGGGSNWGDYYHRRLTDIYQFLVPPGQRILELGCGRGDLLSSLNPSRGVGVDFAEKMLGHARQNHPELHLVNADVHDVQLDETFDVVILSDIVNELWDVQGLLEKIKPCIDGRRRIIVNFYSRLWELPLALAGRMGLARPLLKQNWFAPNDVTNIFQLCGYETVRSWEEILWPLETPIVAGLCNRLLVKLWPFKYLALTNFLIARPAPKTTDAGTARPSVTVVVAARNEAGNIKSVIERTPEMGSGTELIFVEGNSRDNTYEKIESLIPEFPDRNIRLFRQPGKGKGDAVRVGFKEAGGDILMILDADMTVPPEDLPRFYRALVENRGEYINGIRLVYPMERRAMRFLNLLGNKFFSLAFSWLLGQPIKDTLCGTKVLWRRDYETIAEHRSYFGDFDPFGDFDLIFGAAKLNLRMVDLPIRYRERVYGETNIERWRHGWLLLRMVVFAARRLKFV